MKGEGRGRRTRKRERERDWRRNIGEQNKKLKKVSASMRGDVRGRRRSKKMGWRRRRKR